MWGVTYLFFQLKGSSTTYTHLSLTFTNIFPTPEQQKSNFLIKLNHQATNQTPSFSKLLNKRTFNKMQTLPKITMHCNYWNYIKQRKTVSTTLSCPQEMMFADIIHSTIFIIQQIIWCFQELATFDSFNTNTETSEFLIILIVESNYAFVTICCT